MMDATGERQINVYAIEVREVIQWKVTAFGCNELEARERAIATIENGMTVGTQEGDYGFTVTEITPLSGSELMERAERGELGVHEAASLLRGDDRTGDDA